MEPLEPMVEEHPQNRFQFIVTLLIMLTTLTGATVAFLENHASLQEDRAARQAEVYAIQIMGMIVQNGYESDYEAGLFYDHINLSQVSLARQFAEFEAWQQGDANLVAMYQHEAGRLEAMREAIQPHSALLSDPRYAPEDDSGTPDMQLWADDGMAPILDHLEQQNEAADRRDTWGEKADAYVSIVTLLAVALFMFGLSLATSSRVRLLFVLVGTAIASAGTVWTILNYLS
jgi:hypothetical protein